MVKKLSRRSFVIRTGAAVAGLSVLQSQDGAQASEPGAGKPRVAGIIERIEKPHTVHLRTTSGAETVKFLGDGDLEARATFNRDGPATLGDFFIGDSVVAELRSTGRPRRGTHMEILYWYLDGQITEIAPDRLITSGGGVRLAPDTRVTLFGHGTVDVPLSDLAVGNEIAILSRHDPLGGELIARLIWLKTRD